VSNLWAETYDYPIAPTLSDSVDDPAGPFTALQVGGAGNVVAYPMNGPQSAPVTIAVIAGQTLRFPIRRVGATGTTATGLFGLVSSIVRQGPKSL
jgi:hypothetical protein